MTQRQAIQLLDEYVKNPSLKTHCLAVASSMRLYAKLYKEDEDMWELAGILHDMDYEKFPDIHPDKSLEVLEEMAEDPKIIHAIKAHRYTNEIESLFDKALFSCDELSGFVYACVLVRPDKKIAGMEVSSVKKKMKDKGFARNVSREDMYKGAELLGISIEEHIQNVIDALSSSPFDLGI